MTTTHGAYLVHSQERGPHWIAWITRGSETKPERSIIIVGATQAEAEAHARSWFESAAKWGIGLQG